jgi:mediator of RNA polymerase II transcription subunit 16
MLVLGSDILLCPGYRLTVNGQSKAADLTSLLMLHSVATAFKSLLRPSDLSSHDKGPAESLAGNYRVIV